MTIAERVSAFNDGYLYRIPGGAERTSPRVPINLHKVTIGAVVLALMLRAGDFSLAAWLYLVLHGSYGLLWLVKDVAFPDPAWRAPQSLSSAAAVFVFPLGFYYLAPLVMLTPLGGAVPGGWGTTATLRPASPPQPSPATPSGSSSTSGPTGRSTGSSRTGGRAP